MPNILLPVRDTTQYCAKAGCGEGFKPTRANQKYCKPGHRPPNYTLRLTAAQADLILDIASRLRSD